MHACVWVAVAHLYFFNDLLTCSQGEQLKEESHSLLRTVRNIVNGTGQQYPCEIERHDRNQGQRYHEHLLVSLLAGEQ